MKAMRVLKTTTALTGLVLMASVCGCTGDPAQLTFLDFVNTILLAITAAGGVVLIQNA